jgi:LmbE family N-acetylglucosaminyl deacetylase
MRRLLCITAHPDDEAGAFGGALLHYHHQGVKTGVICLTPGQAATNRGGATSDEHLSAMRRAEFEQAAKLLCLDHAEVLNYQDGKLDRADFHAVVEDLVQRIRDFRPQVIMTMGGEGAITGHPDHTMTGLFATAAFHWAGRADRFKHQLTNGREPYRPQKLYYATWLFTIPDRPPIAPSPATTMLEIGPYLKTKLAAFKIHTSQNPLYPGFEEMIRIRGRNELFHLVASSLPKRATAERDLFAGVVED